MTDTSRPESTLETVELETGNQVVNSVIWLHGLGADGHDFEPIVPMLGMGGLAATRFVFPHAPVRPVTINGGMRMRAWYDIRGLDVGRDQDEQGIEESATQVEALIRRENARGIPSERIVLAGFSQGGAVAAHLGLRYPQKLAGLLLLSCYLLFPQRLSQERHEANGSTPVFIGHGNMDPVVPIDMGRSLAAALRDLGMNVDWKEYAVPHSVAADEIADIATWLAETLPGQHSGQG